MGQSTWKVVRVPFVNNSYRQDLKHELTEFRQPNITRSDGDSKSNFNLVIPNAQGKYDGMFKNKDQIQIYRQHNSLTVPEDAIPLIVGTLQDIPVEYDSSKKDLRLKGVDYSETIFEALTFVDATTLTIPAAIQEALSRVNGYNTSFAVTWHPDNLTVKSNGDPFPLVGKRYFYKPLRFMLKELSANNVTQDGQYFWYVNTANQLVWKAGSKFGTSTFNENTDKVLAINIGKDTQGVKNFIVAKGGQLPSGRQVQTYFADYTSIARHGFKFHFFVSENKTVKEYNIQDIYKSYEEVTATTGYPKLDAPFETAWVYTGKLITLKRGTVLTPNQKVTIDTGNTSHNQQDYNDALYWQIYHVLQVEARRIAEDTRYGRIEVEIRKRHGVNPWGISQQVTTQLKEFGMASRILRVKDINYTETSDVYKLTEDTGTL